MRWKNSSEAPRKGKTAMVDRETEARQCVEVERHLLLSIRMMESWAKGKIKNAWRKLERPTVAAMPCKLKMYRYTTENQIVHAW